MTEVPFYLVHGLTTELLSFHVSTYYWFRLTYYSTYLSCVFGIVKFLDLGPTRILSEKGLSNWIGYGLSICSAVISLRMKAHGLGHGDVLMEIFLMTLGSHNNEHDRNHNHEYTGIPYL